MTFWKHLAAALVAATAVATGSLMPVEAQGRREPDWPRLQAETLEHYQAILRMDTSDPPGNEKPVVDYLEQVLAREGIAVQRFEAEPNRVNLVAPGRHRRQVARGGLPDDHAPVEVAERAARSRRP